MKILCLCLFLILQLINQIYCFKGNNPKKPAIDVEDEKEDGLSLTLFDSEVDIAPPEKDHDQNDEQILEFDRPEDLEDINEDNRVINLDENYFIGFEDFLNLDYVKTSQQNVSYINITISLSNDTNENLYISKDPILIFSQNISFTAYHDAKLLCNVSLNYALISTNWFVNNIRIMDCYHTNLYNLCSQKNGDELVIKNISYLNSGEYKCLASAGAFTYSVVYYVVVIKENLFAPTNFISICDNNSSVIKLRWQDDKNPAASNLFYNIFHSNSLNWEEEIIHVYSVKYLDFIPLSGRIYKFRISAANNETESDIINNEIVCDLKKDVPHRNPSVICDNSTSMSFKTAALNITWEPINLTDLNHFNLHYNIFYKPILSNNNSTNLEIFTHKVVMNRAESYAIIDVGKEAAPYLVAIQSINEFGPSKEILKWTQHYSGDGVPRMAVTGLAYKWLNGTHLLVKWQAIDPNSELIHGFLKGYKLRYWYLNWPDIVNEKFIEVNDYYKICDPLINNSSRTKRDTKAYSDLIIDNDDNNDISMILLNITYAFLTGEKTGSHDKVNDQKSLFTLLEVKINTSEICFAISIFNSLQEGPTSETLCTASTIKSEYLVINFESNRILIICLVVFAAILFLIIVSFIMILRCYAKKKKVPTATLR